MKLLLVRIGKKEKEKEKNNNNNGRRRVVGCLVTLIVKKLKISVEQGRVVATTLNILKQ